MYGWLWRRLPFGLPGKISGSVVLLATAIALLWYVVFPWAEPILPFDDVQVTSDEPGGANNVDGNPATGGDVGEPGDEHDLPYDTNRNNPVPSAT